MGKSRQKPVDENAKQNAAILQKRRDRKRHFKQAKKKQLKVEDVVAKYETLAKADLIGYKSFRDFPLSDHTLNGLEESQFTEPTEVQRDSLPFSLSGSDVVAAAKTGSGKTLALIIPLLECLWRQRWSRRTDGLGALIISPTRELALQTFNTINKVGKYHDFSCALLMGGTDVEFEKRRVHSMNIVVCTPGRLQQHLDENDLFQCESLQMLVIDEADRILDMGFATQLNAIVSCLPKERQTLLFSATQTSDIKQLSRVCTNDPVFVSVHEKAIHSTPDELRQTYIICNEEDKARFLTDTFCHLRPGTSLMGLWGTMKQNKRLAVFETFERRKSACLIATDVASRGLDFSGVDWVLQMDAPATPDDYIHSYDLRVGRTARMHKKGAAILFLTPNQEERMMEMMEEKKIPLCRVHHDPSSVIDIRLKMQGVLAAFPELNELGQKYVVAYLRSVYLMSNKSIFDVDAIDAKALAESLGLVAIKRIRFLQKRKEGKKLIIKQKEVFSGHEFGDNEEEKEGDEDGTLFTIKKKDVFNVASKAEQGDDSEAEMGEIPVKGGKTKSRVVTKAKQARAILKKGVPVNRHVVYGEEGLVEEEKGTSGEGWKSKGLDLLAVMHNMPEQDLVDKKEWRDRLKNVKKEKKRKEKEKNRNVRKKGEGDEAIIEGSSDEESVDLSWLPDPDKPKQTSDDEDEHYSREVRIASESEEEEEEEEIRPPSKKSRKSREDNEKAVLSLLTR